MAKETGRVRKVPRFLWSLLTLPSRILYELGPGIFQGRFVLLLTTTGRKSGLRRVTSLQSGELNGDFYVESARGAQVMFDWLDEVFAYNFAALESQIQSAHMEVLR